LVGSERHGERLRKQRKPTLMARLATRAPDPTRALLPMIELPLRRARPSAGMLCLERGQAAESGDVSIAGSGA
jgi:hypothetical protein